MITIKTFPVLVFTAFATIIFAANSAKADVLFRTGGDTYDGPFGFQLVNKGEAKWTVGHEGIGVGNKDDNSIFNVMCSDLNTFTSPEFADSNAGQSYNRVALNDSTFHSANQKQQLQSLYDHVYWKAFDQDYGVIDPAYAAMFQLAVWEIMNDSSDTLSLRNGDLYITDFYNTNADRTGWGTHMSTAQQEQLLAMSDAWFNAIINDSWDLIGYSENKSNLTVWVAEGGTDSSQTFIGVAPTPEPATMLIFGLGMAGFAAGKLRNRIKKNS
ncbi:hypothetical protein FACS1894214_1360 [Planctomycetales bacterium]|nr:hypothetical protein FACS1894214_1360 [Planctomycetales bacterium]